MNALPDTLSDREKDVLLGICKGKCNKKIAEELGICHTTVKKHVYHTYKKLNVSNRFQAILWVNSNLEDNAKQMRY
jgi:two-component system nitrate/nitrite response regulator NarL